MPDDHDDPTDPSDPRTDDERRGDALRALLGGGPVDDGPPPSDVDLDDLRQRAGQRRQRKVVGLAAVAVVLVLLGGSALALGRRGSTPAPVDVAADVGSAAGPGTTVPWPELGSTILSSDGFNDCTYQPSPDGGPPQLVCTGIGVVTTTVPESPTSGDTEPPSGEGPSTSATPPSTPRTTMPPSSSSSDPVSTPTTSPPGGDCGSSTPSGWPTTTSVSPMLAGCLVDAFDVGAHATLRVVVYRNDPDHPVTTTYEVTGVHRVTVVVDARRSEVPPQTLTTQVCTILDAAPGSSDVVSPDGCTPA